MKDPLEAFETRRVEINVCLPVEMADQAEELQRTAPELLDRMVLIGMTQRAVFSRLLGVDGETADKCAEDPA